MKFQLTSCWLLILLILVTCTNEDPDKVHLRPSTSSRAKNFLNEVLSIMEANSINKHKIDWADFKTRVFEKVPDAQTIQDTYPGIREALVLLGDNHSFYLKSDGSGIFVGTLKCDNENIVSPSIPEHVGYVKVNSFNGSSTSQAGISFAEEIQKQIKDQDHQNIKGWIVDIRNNGGGNMYPMIAGIGPILGEGTAGYFIDPDNRQIPWGFLNGSAVVNGFTAIQLNNSYTLIDPNPKVAVLWNTATASSGEVIAISFIGRANTKSFGIPTCGASTGNSTYVLSDGSTLYLTTVYLADRNKNPYGIPVNPDLVVSSNDIITKAVEWIEN